MRIDIYSSAKTAGKHLSVPADTELEKMPFPGTLDPDLHIVCLLVKGLDIQPGDTRIALDSRNIIDQIKEKGFAIHESKVTVTVKLVK